jgi:uncharacterized protein with von Willebrand factor type A (vWA) domain
VGRRTVAIVISDGWDRGDAAVLAGEMHRLRSACYRIIWLNPLLVDPAYEPLCKGMAAALPYVDYFLPFANLASVSPSANSPPSPPWISRWAPRSPGWWMLFGVPGVLAV